MHAHNRFLATAWFLAMFSWSSMAGDSISSSETAKWANYVMPLPHEIQVVGQKTFPVDQVAITTRTNAGSVEKQALLELQALFQEKAGQVPTGDRFIFLMGVLDAKGCVNGQAVEGADRLKTLPNKEQAYLIRPTGKDRLVIAALDERGVYYGAQTLMQLLRPGLSKQAIVIPLAHVTDWPDMEERGIWNAPRDEVLPFFASLKLNFATFISGYTYRTNLPIQLKLDPDRLGILHKHAMVERVQLVNHLNYLGQNFGLYALYPQLKGQGTDTTPLEPQYKAVGRDIANICASQPLWVTILGDMMKELGAQGARNISVWLSEFKGSCGCAECRKSTQVQLETKMVLAAWEEVHRQYPNLNLYIFFSQGDASQATADALLSLPADVKIERVYPMFKPFLDAAARGQWVESYNGAGIGEAHWRFANPGSYIKPITNGYAAKLKGVLGLSSPSIGPRLTVPSACYATVYDYPISMIAEWSWNVNGRSPRQFMEAWGTRHGYNDPSRFADWAQAMADVHFMLTDTGSGTRKNGASMGTWTTAYDYPLRQVEEKIRQRRKINFYSSEELSKAMKLCRQALAIAETLNIPDAAVETRYVTAYLQMHEKLTFLSERLAQLDAQQPKSRKQVLASWQDLKNAISALLNAKARQIEIWKVDATFMDQANKNIYGQWEVIQTNMDAAIKDVIKSESSLSTVPNK